MRRDIEELIDVLVSISEAANKQVDNLNEILKQSQMLLLMLTIELGVLLFFISNGK